MTRSAPKKQRHTAKRIFERLRDEHGYQGSESQVRRYLAENDHRHREVFVPLAQPPGEAQFDFGEALVEIAGVRMKAALAVMSLPYSDAFHVTAYPRECTETFQSGPRHLVRVLRWCPHQDRLRQHDGRGEEGTGGTEPRVDI